VPLAFRLVAGLKPSMRGDVISVVAEFMVDVAGLKPSIRVVFRFGTFIRVDAVNYITSPKVYDFKALCTIRELCH
jgi:hypothetical protein